MCPPRNVTLHMLFRILQAFIQKLLYINEPLSTQGSINHPVWISPQSCIECIPPDKRAEAETKYGFGGYISKAEAPWDLLSGESEFTEGAKYLRATTFLWKRVNYLYHYAYTNIFGIADSLTQNDLGPI